MRPGRESRPMERIESKYKGVRKRKWGKYVSEIRLPNSRERIWLGSYDTAEKAARAFDAALFCLRGSTSNFNFPDNPPSIPGGRSLTPSEIQIAAAQFANSAPSGSGLPTAHSPESSSLSLSSSSHAESPSPSVSTTETAPLDSEIDKSFLDLFTTLGRSDNDNGNNSVSDFGIFPGFDDLSIDFLLPPLPNGTNPDHGQEQSDEVEIFSEDSSLWNF